MRIKVDERTHRYGIDAPSVSKLVDQIIPFPKDEIDPMILDKAIKRGNCLHGRAEFYIKTKMDIGCFCGIKSHDNQWEYLLGGISDRLKDAKVESELSFYNANDEYTGTIDLLVFTGERYLVVDFKTGQEKFEREYCQLSLYKRGVQICNGLDYPVELLIVNSNKRIEYDPTKLVDTGYLDAKLEEVLNANR